MRATIGPYGYEHEHHPPPEEWLAMTRLQRATELLDRSRLHCTQSNGEDIRGYERVRR